jgi:hypothetical protein
LNIAYLNINNLCRQEVKAATDPSKISKRKSRYICKAYFYNSSRIFFVTLTLLGPQASNHQVFISYSNADFDYAQKLYSDLEAAGLEPFLGVAALLPGQDKREFVEKNIRSSRYLVALLSRNSIQDRLPRPEIYICRLEEYKTVLSSLVSL